MVEGDFVDDQSNIALLSSKSMCGDHHSVKNSIGDEIFKLLTKILNSDEKASGDVHTLVSGTPDLSNFNLDNEPLGKHTRCFHNIFYYCSGWSFTTWVDWHDIHISPFRQQ